MNDYLWHKNKIMVALFVDTDPRILEHDATKSLPTFVPTYTMDVMLHYRDRQRQSFDYKASLLDEDEATTTKRGPRSSPWADRSGAATTSPSVDDKV